MAEPKKRARQQEGQKAMSIVRIANKDINGGLNIQRAMDQVKGIGQTMSHSLSYVIEHKFNIDPSTPIGSLNESQVTQVEELIKDPHKYRSAKIPAKQKERHGYWQRHAPNRQRSHFCSKAEHKQGCHASRMARIQASVRPEGKGPAYKVNRQDWSNSGRDKESHYSSPEAAGRGKEEIAWSNGCP
jgi:Ribosomal protein S13